MKNVYFLGTFDRQNPKRTQRRYADIIDITRVVKRSSAMPARSLTPVSLVEVVVADFRRSEKTIIDDYIKTTKKGGFYLKMNQTVLFVNSSGKIGFWFRGLSRLNNCVVYDTLKWRLDGPGENWFNTDNVQYYASQSGFRLIIPNNQEIKDFLRWMKHPAIKRKKKAA